MIQKLDHYSRFLIHNLQSFQYHFNISVCHPASFGHRTIVIYFAKKSNSHFHGMDCRKEKDILFKAVESFCTASFWLWRAFFGCFLFYFLFLFFLLRLPVASEVCIIPHLMVTRASASEVRINLTSSRDQFQETVPNLQQWH